MGIENLFLVFFFGWPLKTGFTVVREILVLTCITSASSQDSDETAHLNSVYGALIPKMWYSRYSLRPKLKHLARLLVDV